MRVIFHTKNIDRTFYRQIIHSYLTDQLLVVPSLWNKYQQFRNSWVIHIYPAEDWEGIDFRSENTGTLNPLIPHGNTGEGIVTAYVIDSTDKGLTSIQNFSAILIEVAHMLLIILMRGKRGILRNDDLGGNKAGKELNVSTQEVHDLQREGKTYQVRTWVNFGNWIFRRWQRYSCIGIDLRNFLKSNV